MDARYQFMQNLIKSAGYKTGYIYLLFFPTHHTSIVGIQKRNKHTIHTILESEFLKGKFIMETNVRKNKKIKPRTISKTMISIFANTPSKEKTW